MLSLPMLPVIVLNVVMLSVLALFCIASESMFERARINSKASKMHYNKMSLSE
jgi:hypothetical protein